MKPGLIQERSIEAGKRLARALFARNPDRVELHLSEKDLAALFTTVFEQGMREGVYLA